MQGYVSSETFWLYLFIIIILLLLLLLILYHTLVQVKSFGSTMTSTSLPSSDLDIVLFGCTSNNDSSNDFWQPPAIDRLFAHLYTQIHSQKSSSSTPATGGANPTTGIKEDKVEKIGTASVSEPYGVPIACWCLFVCLFVYLFVCVLLLLLQQSSCILLIVCIIRFRLSSYVVTVTM